MSAAPAGTKYVFGSHFDPPPIQGIPDGAHGVMDCDPSSFATIIIYQPGQLPRRHYIVDFGNDVWKVGPQATTTGADFFIDKILRDLSPDDLEKVIAACVSQRLNPKSPSAFAFDVLAAAAA